MWYWHIDLWINGKNLSPELNPYICDRLVSTQVPKQFNRERCLQQIMLEQLNTPQKMKFDLYLALYYQVITQKCIKD